MTRTEQVAAEFKDYLTRLGREGVETQTTCRGYFRVRYRLPEPFQDHWLIHVNQAKAMMKRGTSL